MPRQLGGGEPTVLGVHADLDGERCNRVHHEGHNVEIDRTAIYIASGIYDRDPQSLTTTRTSQSQIATDLDTSRGYGGGCDAPVKPFVQAHGAVDARAFALVE